MKKNTAIIELKNKESLKIAAAVLKKDGTIIFPTDTIYGIGTIATAAGAKKIGKIKNRPGNKPFPLLVSSLVMAKKFAEINPQQEKFLKKNWPGAVTAILPAKIKNRGLTENGKIGLRQPNHPWLLKLIAEIGQPLIGTSANPSGQSGTTKIKEVFDYFPNGPELIINAGNLPKRRPSKVIDLTTNPPRILR